MSTALPLWLEILDEPPSHERPFSKIFSVEEEKQRQEDGSEVKQTGENYQTWEAGSSGGISSMESRSRA